ncbi:MAG TPA: hypothetical protein PLV42_03985 [bacterium]|nr:hypothetical protein [bacterium]
MKNILFFILAICAFAGCTKEPDIINIEEVMESVLAEMDYWGTDEDLLFNDDDALLTEEDPTDGDILLDEADDLLSDD